MKPALLTLLAAAWGLAQTSPAPGLLATYTDGRRRIRRIDPTPNLYLDPQESAHPSLDPAFQAEWTGFLSVLQAGEYTIEAGAAQITVDGRAAGAGPVRLSPGRHPIEIRYRRTPGAARVLLQWRSAAFPAEPVPASLLTHSGGLTREEILVERGRDLVEEYGCVNCHAAGSSSLQGRRGPDLTGAGSRLDARWLYRWLEDPGAFRAGAVMPALANEQDRRDAAAYLASLQAGAPAGRPPRRLTQTDVARGGQLFGALGCTACHQEEGLRLEGLGSKTTAPALAAFLKAPAQFDPGGRMPSLLLTDEETLQLAAYLLDSHNAAFERPWNPGDPGRGRALVQSEGCLACHALRDPEPLPNRFRAPGLTQLAPGRGCLAAAPGPGVPHYRLTAEQREAAGAFLASYRQHPDRSPAPVYQLYRALRQLRCTACHQTGLGAAAAALAEAAPPLTAAGAKLRTDWIAQVLSGRQRVRGWTDLRMPDYDPRHASPLAAAFAKAAGVEPGDGPAPPALTAEQRTRGRDMIGSNAAKGGLACIGCHDWGAARSTGEDGPQLLNAARRLRYDWFHRWMRNPARILSGTSMPAYFTSLDRRRAGEKIDELWAALAAGDKLPLPDGVRPPGAADPEARPAPDREPVVVRWDMPEATPAAIAVGLPGGVSYCFDAGESRLRYAWRGGFVDLSGTLHRKTEPNRLTPTARLIGEVFFRSEDFPLRLGSPERIPQRRFRGYRLAGGLVEFHYQVEGTEVYEQIAPAGTGIARRFRIGRVDQPMWFVDGKKMEIPRGADVRFEVTHP